MIVNDASNEPGQSEGQSLPLGVEPESKPARKTRARKTVTAADATTDATTGSTTDQAQAVADGAVDALLPQPAARKRAARKPRLAQPEADAQAPKEGAATDALPAVQPTALADKSSSDEVGAGAESAEAGAQRPMRGTGYMRQRRGRFGRERLRDQAPALDENGNPIEVAHDESGEADGGDGRPEHFDKRREAEPILPQSFAQVVSGEFDSEQDAIADGRFHPARRVLPPQPDMPKLHKVLAQAGLGSRLDMEDMIMDGRITVNNQAAHIGQRVQWGDRVLVDGKPLRFRIQPPPARVIAYHKPVGEIVTYDDPQNRPTVFRRLPKLRQGKWLSVGRLDINTEGLLLFTNSGELANRLMHPRFGLTREYAVRILGELGSDNREQLLSGVTLDDGPAQFLSIEDGGGDGANRWYKVTIGEGRNREVRRLFEAMGHAVSRLIRIQYGPIALPRGLKRGYYLELDDRSVKLLDAQAAQALGETPDGEGGADFAGDGEHRPDIRRNDRSDRNGRNDRGGERTARSSNRGRSRFDRDDRPARQQQEPSNANMPREQQGADQEDEDDFNMRGVSHENGFAQQKRGRSSGNAFGAGGSGGGNWGRSGGAERADDGPPRGIDPTKTSFGYITQDGFRKGNSSGSGGGMGGGGANNRRGGNRGSRRR